MFGKKRNGVDETAHLRRLTVRKLRYNGFSR